MVKKILAFFIVFTFVGLGIFQGISLYIGSRNTNSDNSMTDEFDLKENDSIENEFKGDFNYDNNDEIFDDELFREDFQGDVIIGVMLSGLDEANKLMFEISMDTHTVDLEQYDLGEISSVLIGEKYVEKGIEWEIVSGAGHHIFGILTVPVDELSKDLLNEPINLEIKGLDDIPSRTFAWN